VSIFLLLQRSAKSKKLVICTGEHRALCVRCQLEPQTRYSLSQGACLICSEHLGNTTAKRKILFIVVMAASDLTDFSVTAVLAVHVACHRKDEM